MKPSQIIRYYSQEGFIEFLLDFSKNREVVPSFFGKFGKRPQTFQFRAEVEETIRMVPTSFHFSIEKWVNPLALSPSMDKQKLDDNRLSWDLIFDIDSEKFEYSKKCAFYVIEALKYHDIKNISVKFSGNKGFHIGISFDEPKKIENKEVKNLYPYAARIIGDYIRELIKEFLSEDLNTKDPFSLVNIDSVAISSRHLIRMPYSLNEKSWLVSVPIDAEEINEFEREKAIPEKINFEKKFLDKKVNAKELFMQAFDWIRREEKKNIQKKGIKIKGKVKEEFFPPCIKRILGGLEDGKKRALFILINFYSRIGYSWEEIELMINEWNKKNNPQLREGYIKSQIKWAKKQGGLMPPNCVNMIYKEIGVCNPDNLCNKIKNPVVYSFRKHKFLKKK